MLWSRVVQRSLFFWQSDFELTGESEKLATELEFLPRYPDVMLAYDINEDGLLTPEFRAYVESVLNDDR